MGKAFRPRGVFVRFSKFWGEESELRHQGLIEPR